MAQFQQISKIIQTSLTPQCFKCGKTFHTFPSRLKKGLGKYCSKKCFYLERKGISPWNKGLKGFSGENNNAWKGGRVNRTCIKCKTKFLSYPRVIQKGWGNFCSKKCSRGNMSSEYFRKIGLKGLIKQQTMKEPTSIETKVYAELKNRGLLFERQYLVNGKFLVDAYIPSLNLIIEADGRYWHSLERVIKKDKAENAYLTKCGFDLVRLSEEEINNGSFKERILVN